MRPLAYMIVALAVAACSRSDGEPAAWSGAAGSPAAAAAPVAHATVTTDAAIAVGNLDAQIEGWEQARARRPNTIEWWLQLSGAYGARGRALGRIADYETALALADGAVKRWPDDADARLARAAARATFHRFADAAADLDAAAARGAAPAKVDDARASLWSATGREVEALALRQRLAAARRDLPTLGALAMSLAALGRDREAEETFAAAEAAYRDVSPFPVATLYFQAGLVEERRGRPASARERYEAARARLPQHAQATAHLAALLALAGQRLEAAALLRPLVASSDDPEYAGALAGLVGGDEAKRLKAQAARRYEELLGRHPEAFLDHAARFWLGVGGDAARARALAERNVILRPTADAFALAIEAALADGRLVKACGFADRARALPASPAALQLAAHRAYKACARDRQAEEALAAAGGG